MLPSSRAQVGIEYLVFTAFILLVVGILFAYSFVTYSQTVQQVQTQAAVDALSAAVDFVYAKGPGNAIVVDIKLPTGLTELRTDQNVVRANLQQVGGVSTYFSFTKVAITPTFLFYEEGLYSVRVSMGDTNASLVNV